MDSLHWTTLTTFLLVWCVFVIVVFFVFAFVFIFRGRGVFSLLLYFCLSVRGTRGVVCAGYIVSHYCLISVFISRCVIKSLLLYYTDSPDVSTI